MSQDKNRSETDSSDENPAARDQDWSMDDLLDGMAGFGDDYDLEDLSRAYAQLLAEQEQLSESLDAQGTDGARIDGGAVGSDPPASPPPFSRTPTEPTSPAGAGPAGAGPAGTSAGGDNAADALAPVATADRSRAKGGPGPVVGRAVGAAASEDPSTRDGDLANKFFDLRRATAALVADETEDRVAMTPQRIVEAILFVGTPDNAPVSGRQLASLMRGVSPDEVETYVDDLNATYQADGSAFQISKDVLGYRMELAPSHLAVRKQFYGQIREVRLAQGVIDILAMVAYHQPITKSALEKMVGSSCSGALNQLLRRNLVCLTKEPGRGPVYRTTEKFLELFDLDSLEDLPQSEAVDAEEENPQN